MASSVKRTYGSRTSRPALPLSSPSSTLASSPTSVTKRKRPFAEQLSFSNLPKLSHPTKRQKLSDNAKPKQKEKEKQKTLTQLHFCIDQPVLRTCPLCDLSYTKGAPDDETLHRAHCARVQKGMEWGREEEKEKLKADVVEIATGVKLKDGRKGRIISFRADSGGKIGSKVRIHSVRFNIDTDMITCAADSSPCHNKPHIVVPTLDTCRSTRLQNLPLPPTNVIYLYTREDRGLCHCSTNIDCYGDRFT